MGDHYGISKLRLLGALDGCVSLGCWFGGWSRIKYQAHFSLLPPHHPGAGDYYSVINSWYDLSAWIGGSILPYMPLVNLGSWESTTDQQNHLLPLISPPQGNSFLDQFIVDPLAPSG